MYYWKLQFEWILYIIIVLFISKTVTVTQLLFLSKTMSLYGTLIISLQDNGLLYFILQAKDNEENRVSLIAIFYCVTFY